MSLDIQAHEKATGTYIPCLSLLYTSYISQSVVSCTVLTWIFCDRQSSHFERRATTFGRQRVRNKQGYCLAQHQEWLRPRADER